MNLLKIYLSSEKDKASEDYLYGIDNNKNFLIIQCIILIIFSFIAYIMSAFNTYMVVFVILSVFNAVYVYLNIKKSWLLLEQLSPKYQVKYFSDMFFFNIKELEQTMADKNSKKSEISNWRRHYIDSFKSELSLRNFKEVVEKLQKHIGDILNAPYTVDQKAFFKFRKKEIDDIKKSAFPEIDDLIKDGKINLKANKAARASIVPGGNTLVKNLKILGLSANTRNLNVVEQRYRELVKMYHPDRSENEDTSQKLAEINVAYLAVKKQLKE